MPNIIRNFGFEDTPVAGHPVPEWVDVQNAEQESFSGPDGSASSLRITAGPGDLCPEGQIKQRYHAPHQFAWSDLFFWVYLPTEDASWIYVTVVSLGIEAGDPDTERSEMVILADEPREEWIQKRVLVNKGRKIKRIKIEFMSLSEGAYCYLDDMYLNAEDDPWTPSLRRPPDIIEDEVIRALRWIYPSRPPMGYDWLEHRMSMRPEDIYPAFANLLRYAVVNPERERLDNVERQLNAIHRLLLETRCREMVNKPATKAKSGRRK